METIASNKKPGREIQTKIMEKNIVRKPRKKMKGWAKPRIRKARTPILIKTKKPYIDGIKICKLKPEISIF